MKVKDLWIKYKVFIIGAVIAIIQAVVGLNQTDQTISWVTIGMAAVTALSAWVANNLRGQAMSIMGIVLSAAVYLFQSHDAHVKVDGMHLFLLVLEQLGILLGGYNAPPFKNATYETNKTIVLAKENPPVASQQVSDAKKEEVSK